MRSARLRRLPLHVIRPLEPLSISRLCALSVAVALLCPLLAGCGGDSDGTGSTVEGPAWNRDPGDATRGPAAWGEIDPSFEQCMSGDRQSPVDIARPNSAEAYPSSSSTIRRRRS